MNLKLYEFYDDKGGATILIALAIIFLVGFALSRITKLLKLPNVTGYILSGVLIGPFILDLIPHNIIDNMSFISDLALGFIAFGVGKFFKKDVLKATGIKVVIITTLEALAAGILVTLVVGIAFPNMGWSFALLLGAIATATAPASTMMTINQYNAKGEFVNTLLQVVALDDVICLLIFSIVTAIVQGSDAGAMNVWNIILPIIYNILFIVIGFLGGIILSFLVKGRSANSKLIIAVGIVCIISGSCILLDISPLLSCMVFGATYINITQDEKLFKYVDHFDPPIMLLFFVVSGMNMDLSAFATIGVIGVVYFVIRIVGKYFGAWGGCKITKRDNKITNYLGFALIPQAGVAIGLAFLGQRMLPEDIGNTFLSVILCSSVLYEMCGPVLAKFALIKSGAISKEMLNESKSKKKDVIDNVAAQHVDVSRIENIHLEENRDNFKETTLNEKVVFKHSKVTHK